MLRRLASMYIILFFLLLPIKATLAYPGLWIELYYPDNYRFALWEWKPIEHVTVTGPEDFFAESANTIISLPSPPIIGNTYRFDIRFDDGSSEQWNYTVTTINNNFAHMISPADGDEINTTAPNFSWNAVTGIDRYVLLIYGEEGEMWSASLPAGTTSCSYNSDGTATGNLQFEKSYHFFLHAFDSIGHQATTTGNFYISKPCTEIKSSRKYRMELQYDTRFDRPETLWFPIPHLWEGNGVKNLNIIEISPAPTDRYYDPNGTGTEIGYWELSGNGTEIISILFTVELSLIRHCIDENQKWPPYDTNSKLYQKNTAPTPWVQSDHPEIVGAAQSIIGSETNPYKQARLIFNWVSSEIQGSPQGQPPEPDGDALLVLKRGTAGCGGYANLFVAFCRSQGIPARNVATWVPPAEDGATFFEDGSHCYDCADARWGTHTWAEFYLPNYGWVQCDPTQPNYFARIPQERIAISKGNDMLFDHDHSCDGDEGWNLIGQEAPWFHLPRVPCQSGGGMTLNIKLIRNPVPIRKPMPWIPLLLFED